MQDKERLKKKQASAYAVCVGAITVAALALADYIRISKKLALQQNTDTNTSKE